jgi:hypothetical protein
MEFDQLMNIVYSRWSDKAYPMPVKNRIWFFVKDLPQKSFEKIIYDLLDTQRYAPMPHEFRTLAYAEYGRLGLRLTKEPESKPSSEARCWDCGDSGNLFAVHRAKNTTATFRCHCVIGAKRSVSQGAQWSLQWEKLFEKEPIHLDIKGDWRPRTGLSLNQMVNELASIRSMEEK